MSEQPTQSATWTLATALAAIGGFLAAVGVFLPWASATGVRTTEIFGEEVIGTTTSGGNGDVPGLIVFGVGAAVGVLGIVALLVPSEGLRRSVGPVAIVGGAVILVACAFGALRAEEVLGDLPPELADPSVAVETTVAAGVFVSAAGGLIAAAGGLVARRPPVRS